MPTQEDYFQLRDLEKEADRLSETTEVASKELTDTFPKGLREDAAVVAKTDGDFFLELKLFVGVVGAFATLVLGLIQPFPTEAVMIHKNLAQCQVLHDTTGKSPYWDAGLTKSLLEEELSPEVEQAIHSLRRDPKLKIVKNRVGVYPTRIEYRSSLLPTDLKKNIESSNSYSILQKETREACGDHAADRLSTDLAYLFKITEAPISDAERADLLLVSPPKITLKDNFSSSFGPFYVAFWSAALFTASIVRVNFQSMFFERRMKKHAARLRKIRQDTFSSFSESGIEALEYAYTIRNDEVLRKESEEAQKIARAAEAQAWMRRRESLSLRKESLKRSRSSAANEILRKKTEARKKLDLLSQEVLRDGVLKTTPSLPHSHSEMPVVVSYAKNVQDEVIR